MNNKRVIIVGGGLAGLYSAYQLEQLNIPYLLLEAKDVFGGRIYSEQAKTYDENAALHDLGPTWIFPHHHQMKALVADLKAHLFDQHIEGAVVYHAAQHTQPQIIENGQGPLLHRLAGGLYKLILALQAKLSKDNYQLSCQVEQLTKVHNSWQVTVKNTKDDSTSVFETDHLVLALPPRIINEFLTPVHWASKSLTAALVAVPTWMASQAKFIATYNQAFWRTKGLAGQAFSRVGPMIEIHDASAHAQQGFALFGFIGLSAQAIESLSVEQVKALCINQLSLLFGDEAQRYSQCYLKSWGSDPYVAVEKDIVEPSNHPYFDIKAFAGELSSLNLYLAGSEFAQQEAGYLEGALFAANTTISSLKKNLMTSTREKI
ncbi:flavin monoamine oxidase family protein [Colwellia hornerae]|uniref:Monoamine oxidase n=1 Tax=Colwellia hornerae TaxID=89402 RepID=A0A5C6QJ63_9GAMM|nr:FAD-dependent oxidoreductase [Colwellia hornerae]TWX53403.1 monoamine oxidase [Colwellia hornerae]TWX60223.1 monoamine oxidase [Colwellia hornerae]TWX68984.1 monoamine oxidase [Colwellia hornerae]